MVHPVIRLVSFLLLAALLTISNIPQLLGAGVLIGMGYVVAQPISFRPALAMLRRARWLLLSIAIIYFWFTPGTPMMGEMHSPVAAWLPSYEGVLLGLTRIMSLSMMVIAVSLLLQTTVRDELLAAIYWLTAPLVLAGVSRDKLVVRLALSLEAVNDVQALVRCGLDEQRADAGKLLKWNGFASQIYKFVLMKAETVSCEPITMPARTAPPVYQWFLPVILVGIIFAIGLFG